MYWPSAAWTLRLTDNLVNFLHFDNLQNRYDHFILAGASLLCSEKHSHLFAHGQYEKYTHWKKSLNDHIELTVNLHKIKDIYIIEHQDCGAYSNLLDPGKVDLSSLDKEIECHKKFVTTLADEIHAEPRTEKNEQGGENEYRLNVHCFLSTCAAMWNCYIH
ncbi:MAG: hypothetical protein V4658_09935 [Bacteroidota bacterium]